MSDKRLLAIHAHPDDESSKGAATTAKYAAEGAEVLVLTCTGGERGDVINPAMDKPGVKENMGEIRREEMAKAAAALGVEHRWLGHVDSGLPGGDPFDPDLKNLLPEGCFALIPGDDGSSMDHQVVWMRIAANLVISDDDLGTELTNGFHELLRYFIVWNKCEATFRQQIF